MKAKIREQFKQRLMKRLSVDKTWALSYMGEFASLIIDVDNLISMAEIAKLMGTSPITVTRWFKEVIVPGKKYPEQRAIKQRMVAIFEVLREGLEDGSLPSEDVLAYVRANLNEE